MNSELRQQVSAFVDGELSSDEAELLVRRLARDSELREYAGTLMDIGRHMRGERLSADSEFAARVSASLNESAPAEQTMAAVRSVGASPKRPTSQWFQAAAGGALTLAVAIGALNWMNAPVDDGPVVVERDVEIPVRDAAAEAGVDYTVPTEVSSPGLVIADTELAAYYLNHSQSRRSLAPGATAITMLESESSEVETDADAIDEALPQSESRRSRMPIQEVVSP
ncbi:MAG: sigma-E factor negative regulatory protein [Pseudomonadota bacterium]